MDLTILLVFTSIEFCAQFIIGLFGHNLICIVYFYYWFIFALQSNCVPLAKALLATATILAQQACLSDTSGGAFQPTLPLLTLLCCGGGHWYS